METKAAYKIRRFDVYWLCPHCGAVIGEIVRTAHPAYLRTEHAEIIGKGRAECPICGRWKTWHENASRDTAN